MRLSPCEVTLKQTSETEGGRRLKRTLENLETWRVEGILDLHKSGNELSLDLHKSGNQLSLDVRIKTH